MIFRETRVPERKRQKLKRAAAAAADAGRLTGETKQISDSAAASVPAQIWKARVSEP